MIYMEEAKRSSLPDNLFGLPEDRKFPLDTEQHVRSAIKLFGHCDESKKHKLAKNIEKAANKYGIEIPETTQVYKYLNESYIMEHESIAKNVIDKDGTLGYDSNGNPVNGKLGSISNGILDSNIKHRIEEYDENREKLILESKDVVAAYQLFLDCEIKKMLDRKYEKNGNYYHGLADNLGSAINDILELSKHLTDKQNDEIRKDPDKLNTLINPSTASSPIKSKGLTQSDVAKIMKEYHYIEDIKDPQLIKNLLYARQKYCNGIISLLQQMIKINYGILGIDISTADAISKGLGDKSTRKQSMAQIREIINKNKSKFVKSNCIDIRSLGGGICYNGDVEYLGDFNKSRNLDNMLQELLNYDVIIMHHGSESDISKDIYYSLIEVNFKHLVKENEKELNKYYDSKYDINGDDAPTLNGGWVHVLARFISEKEYSYEKFCKDARVKYNENDHKYESFYNYCKRKAMEFATKAQKMNNDEVTTQNKWVVMSPIYTDGGSFVDMNKLVKWCIEDTLKHRKENNIITNKPVKIKILSCNPGGHKLDPEITNRKDVMVRYSLYSNYIESANCDDIYDSINNTLTSLNEMCYEYEMPINEEYITEDNIASKTWHGIFTIAKNLISLIIDLVKKFIEKIKELIMKIRAKFKSIKKELSDTGSGSSSYKISTSYIRLEAASIVSVNTNSYDDLEKQILKSIDTIAKEMNKRMKQQTEITNKIKSLAEKNIKTIKESYIEESLETILTTNPFEKQLTLYHGSSFQYEEKIIKPDAYCAGTRLSQMRMASFWAPTFEYAKLFGLFRLINKTTPYDAIFGGDCYHIYVKPSEYTKIKNEIKNKCIWVYEKTLDKKYINAGHSYTIDEYTINVPVKPDKSYCLKYKDFIDLFEDSVIKLPDDSDETMRKYCLDSADKMAKGGRTPKNLMKLFIYHNGIDYLDDIRDYKKLSKNDLDNIIKLNKKLNSYEYILQLKNGQIAYDVEYEDFANYISVTPQEFEKNCGGICWDYTAYEANYFSKHFPNVNYKTYFHVIDDKNACPTHTFLIFEFNNKYYWFESSWKPTTGIYEFNSEQDALQYIHNALFNEVYVKTGRKALQYKSYLIEYNALDKKLFHISVEKYMGYMTKLVNSTNSEIKNTNNRIEPNSIFNESYIMENDFNLPDDETPSEIVNGQYDSIQALLDDKDPKHIYLSSDWHLFKNHYKKEANYVNTNDIISWCKKNIKYDDIFMYLGDISYRWANEEDKSKAQEIFKSLPGIKILVLGNHDIMAGKDFYEGCGFHYVFQELKWSNYTFTHKPIQMENTSEDALNIHGHIHKWEGYNTTDGSKNVNVYPWYYNNKPVTLDYIINHKDKLMKDNKRTNWVGMGESTIEDPIIKECSDMINDFINKTKKIDEWAMASFNPILPTAKPYILKAVNDSGDVINSKLYALSPDIISDKYLVVDENSKLSIVDSSYFNDYNLEVYQYTGNELNIGKLKEAYDNNTIVSPNYIYETLSGKELLSSDQIDFDESFTKVDLELLYEERMTELSTINEQYNSSKDMTCVLPIINESSILNNCTTYNFDILEDADGVFARNRYTGKRTKSVDRDYQITEAMIKTII